MKVLISTILFCLLNSFNHAQITFQKTYGGTAMETCYDAKQTKDKGYIMVGQTYSFGAGYSDVYLVKTDSAGNLQWTRTYGGNDDDGGYYVEQTADSGYIIIGYTFSFGIGQEDIYIIKTNAAGDTLWTEAFGDAKYDIGRCIKQTNDGGYIFTGTTYSFTPTLYLVKLNASGTQVWVQTFGGDTLLDEGYAVQQTWDGGYIIAGSSTSFNPHPHVSDVYLIKTNALGILQWSKTYGGAGEDNGYGVQQTSDGGYIIIGTTHSFGEGNGDIYLIKTDGSGNLSWSKTYGGPNFDDGLAVQEALGGGYFIAGTTENYLGGISYVCLLKTDASGNLLSAETFGGSSCSNTGVSVHQTHDGGCIVGGNTCSYSIPGGGDFYLMKTEYFDNLLCSNGALTLTSSSPQTIVSNPLTIHGPQVGNGGYKTTAATQINSGGTAEVHCFAIGTNELNEKDFSTHVFPNPCHDYTTITISDFKKNNSELELHLFDVLGREIEIKYDKNTSSTNAKIVIMYTNNLPAGVYFCKIKNEYNFVAGMKILVNK